MRNAIFKSVLRLAGDLANIALKSTAATYAAVKTLELMGLLVKY